ncbi:hypothetical protein ACFPFX_11990 [Streptomyces mauvecolor]|uniref:Uncharacterized protein n=1 Tax=Streptomyces mauvecolor TaxID=58345 RepID=A0ABV9UIX7_9ACTN
MPVAEHARLGLALRPAAPLQAPAPARQGHLAVVPEPRRMAQERAVRETAAAQPEQLGELTADVVDDGVG